MKLAQFAATMKKSFALSLFMVLLLTQTIRSDAEPRQTASMSSSSSSSNAKKIEGDPVSFLFPN